MAKMPSINNVIGLPNELFGFPPENRQHIREIAKRFWEIQWLKGLCERALEDWQNSEAVQGLADYIAAAHDDGTEGRYTVEGYGQIEIDWDGSIKMVPQPIAEEEAECQTDTL